MAPIPPNVGEPKLIFNNESPDLPTQWYELGFNGRTLRYTVEIIGNQPQPSNGYPVYIGMHGGGTSVTGATNNRDWTYVGKTFFRTPIIRFHENTKNDPAILVCPRGISTGKGTKESPLDEWNLHCQPESYVLIEGMIMSLISSSYEELKFKIDPNRVILWGFSAGGDGAFRLGTEISDRFSAVIPAAGHPGGDIRWTNSFNLKLLLQVGEDDYYENENPAWSFQRAEVYLRLGVNRIKDTIKKNQVDDPKFFRYSYNVMRNEFRYDVDAMKKWGLAKPGDPHNWWSSPKKIDEKQQSLIQNDDNIKDWLAGLKNRQVTLDGKYYESIVIDPVLVLNGERRNPIPGTVVWDLTWRPEGWEKKFHYWLYLRKFPKDLEDKIKASLAGSENAYYPEYACVFRGLLQIVHKNEYMGYLLKDDQCSKPFEVVDAGGYSIWKGVVNRQVKIEEETLKARGDPNFQFSAMIYLVKNGEGWDVKQAKSLDE